MTTEDRSEATLTRGGDVILHGPVLFLSPELIAGGAAGQGPDGRRGGSVHIRGGDPEGRVLIEVASEDPHVAGAVYAEGGFLKVSAG